MEASPRFKEFSRDVVGLRGDYAIIVSRGVNDLIAIAVGEDCFIDYAQSRRIYVVDP